MIIIVIITFNIFKAMRVNLFPRAGLFLFYFFFFLCKGCKATTLSNSVENCSIFYFLNTMRVLSSSARKGCV